MVKDTYETEVWPDEEIMQTEEAEEEEADVTTCNISHYPADYTLKTYLDKWDNKQLLIPEFQRNFVWGQVQASKLIESFLLGLPVPAIFLYKERKTNKLMVLDGQQRIFSTIRYFKNEFDEKIFRLKGVDGRWEGKVFEELAESDRYQLEDAVLRAIVVQQLDPNDDSSVFQIFERLNTGGVNLNAMEVRKCVYSGEFYNLLDELNRLHAWRALIGKPKPDRRLKDIEFILRTCAFHDGLDKYEKPMKRFLNMHMIKINKLTKKERNKCLQGIRQLFTDSSEYLLEEVGEKPFHLRSRLNYALMDSVMYCACEAVNSKVKGFKGKFQRLLKDANYIETVTYNTSDEITVRQRFAIARKYLLS